MSDAPHDPGHWLWRLSASGWCQAAARELEAGAARVGSRRTAITHARRAAGMALNGVLVAIAGAGADRMSCETRWGRSYIDHLRALAGGDDETRAPLSLAAAASARALLEIGVMPERGLVQLSAGAHAPARQALELAETLVRACAEVVADADQART
ncbi:MAG: hypothetical protein H6713_02120 [Myxococcales bacterium]|nr:hypothetical protein [Myxococcales bacterium]MCB9748782.1 hypothetical protein [Myxococcales bacterium]